MESVSTRIYNLSRQYNIELPFYKHCLIKRDKLNFTYDNIQSISIPILNNCNLFCAYCDNFIPLRKEIWYEESDNFERNISQLKNICDKIKFIFIIGGEPFLHPNIVELCTILRKYYSDITIGIHTNGFPLLDIINDKILYNLSKLNIAIHVSVYPIMSKEKQKIIRKRCAKYNIICHFIIKNVFIFAGLLDKKNNDTNYHGKCIYTGFDNTGKRLSYRCTQLNSNGDLYFCALPANIHRLNEYFNLNYEVIENKDYVNIYKIKTEKEIIQLYNNDIDFCKYCGNNNKEVKPWRRSKKDISEWVTKIEK